MYTLLIASIFMLSSLQVNLFEHMISSSQSYKQTSNCHWVTIKGKHVCIENN